MKAGYIILSSGFVISSVLAFVTGDRIFGGLMIIASQLVLILGMLDEISERRR